MYIGVDLGTTVTKAVGFDDDGRQLQEATRPTRLDHPAAGRFEQDIGEVLTSALDVIREVAAASPEPPRLVALTGQGDGLWLVDAEGNGVRPACSWLDARSSAILDRWTADGVVDEVFRRSGNRMFPGAAGPLLAAVRAEEPEVVARAGTAAYCKDVVMQRLTGLRGTDVSDASAPFLDPRTQDYDEAALRACGLDDVAHLLAPVVRTGPVAELRPDVATDLGLAAGTPVSAGPYDLPAAATGAGVEEVGDALLTVGTTLACQVVTRTPPLDAEPAGLLLGTWTEGVWLRAMPAMVGTALLDRALALVGAGTDQLAGMLAESGIGAHGVTVLPYWSEAGERAPFVDTRARGSIDGLDLSTTPADLVRATCEAIAYAARHCLDAAGRTGRVTVCGGGARSAEWTQILADVLNTPLHTTDASQVAARGAVIGGIGATGSVAAGPTWVAPSRVVEPDPGRAASYDEGYAHYLRRVEAARERWADPAPLP